MNQEKFDKIIERRIEKIVSVLKSKAKEYASSSDRLHNFKVAARIKNETPEQALWGMFIKHLVSILDIIDDTKKGVVPTQNMTEEKIGDAINYFILLDALLQERRENN